MDSRMAMEQQLGEDLQGGVDRRGGYGGGRGGDYPREAGGPRGRGPTQRYDHIMEQLAFMQGPTTHLETKEAAPRKFTGRCRLFAGNLPHSMTEDEFKAMFEAYGEVAEVYVNSQKGYGFVTLDTRENAEAAKAALDLTQKDGRCIRVRFAKHGAALKVTNLSPWVSNELLEASFSVFGDVERAVVIVDERGRSVGEGIVEFSRKQAAALALKKCTEECFLLTSSPRPVMVEPLDQKDFDDGLPEINFQINNREFKRERELPPRLAEPGSFECDFGQRWKKLYDIEKQKRMDLDKSIMDGRATFEQQMESCFVEYEAKLLREKLRMMEEQSSILARERELRREEERRREEQRRQEELLLLQQQEEILRRKPDEGHYGRYNDPVMQESPMRQMAGAASELGAGAGGGRGMRTYDYGYESMESGGRYGSMPGDAVGGGSGGISSYQGRYGQSGQGYQSYQTAGVHPEEAALGGMNGMHGAARDMLEADEYGLEAKRRRY